MSLDTLSVKPHDRLQSALADDLDAVGALIRARMASEHAPRIPEVTAHLVEAGGKRVRPMLTLAAARICGYEGPFHVHLAATVEFIHTATLLHDDVVDGSEQRRGRPAANLLWDNKSSVLVGDYLFARSFQLMTEAGIRELSWKTEITVIIIFQILYDLVHRANCLLLRFCSCTYHLPRAENQSGGFWSFYPVNQSRELFWVVLRGWYNLVNIN